MDNIVKVKQILVVRNDSSTNWEGSDYILRKGEIGVSWVSIDGANRPIMKVGDGEHFWIELPQSESILQDDIYLSYDFGRHKTENGFVNAGGKGMTVAEWIRDALSTTLAPKIVQPNYSMSILSVDTDTGTSEIGSIIDTIKWSTSFTPGWYEYGSYGNRDNFIPELSVIYYADFNNNILFDENTTGIPGGEFSPNVQIDAIGKVKYGRIETSATWSDAINEPVNNKGEKVPGAIKSKTQLLSSDIYMTGYREGCFFGGMDEEITSENIRKLNATHSNYHQGPVQFEVSPGADKIVIAYDARYAGPTSIYNDSVNAEMIDNFVTEEIEIPGANAFEPITYKIMIYEPAEAYINPAKITITLG